MRLETYSFNLRRSFQLSYSNRALDLFKNNRLLLLLAPPAGFPLLGRSITSMLKIGPLGLI